jgi:hypothetical protein
MVGPPQDEESQYGRDRVNRELMPVDDAPVFRAAELFGNALHGHIVITTGGLRKESEKCDGKQSQCQDSI